MQHRRFSDLPAYLKSGDVMVFNNSRVIRARLFATRLDNRKRIEILLLRRLTTNTWETLIGSKKKIVAGLKAEIEGGLPFLAEVLEVKAAGLRIVRFSDETLLPRVGHVPLPPYIHTPLADPERYQTVYAEPEGSIAAPTAGLHFTRPLLARLEQSGIRCVFVTLHVGLNTFRPVQTADIESHPIFPEYGLISPEAAAEIRQARAEERRVICVGTTSVRLLESAAHSTKDGTVRPWDGWVNDFIYPGYQFKVMDALITNFHLPQSTLLMLVSAFAGRDLILRAYQTAVDLRYRFYSFGDAMLVL